jgi:hypothetical protein
MTIAPQARTRQADAARSAQRAMTRSRVRPAPHTGSAPKGCACCDELFATILRDNEVLRLLDAASMTSTLESAGAAIMRTLLIRRVAIAAAAIATILVGVGAASADDTTGSISGT